jgi:hypothetical protein
MTVTEFVKKYGVPHTIVYNASFNTPTRKAAFDAINFPEQELYDATAEELKNSITYHQKKINTCKDRLKKLTARKAINN